MPPILYLEKNDLTKTIRIVYQDFTERIIWPGDRQYNKLNRKTTQAQNTIRGIRPDDNWR